MLKARQLSGGRRDLAVVATVQRLPPPQNRCAVLTLPRGEGFGVVAQASCRPRRCVQASAPALARGAPDAGVVLGEQGLLEVTTHPQADIVVAATSGLMGLEPTLAAIRAGKTIALANKETLVMAGHLVMREAQRSGVSILPVDSEHSAIWQCLRGERSKEVNRLLLTASGGPFRRSTLEQIRSVTVEQALAHPTWRMGPKITVDSATLMNKGLEILEAHWFFGIPYERIDVIVHPESIIHSMVEFVDGSLKMQASLPSMHLPILDALSYPARLNTAGKGLVRELHWSDVGHRPERRRHTDNRAESAHWRRHRRRERWLRSARLQRRMDFAQQLLAGGHIEMMQKVR